MIVYVTEQAVNFVDDSTSLPSLSRIISKLRETIVDDDTHYNSSCYIITVINSDGVIELATSIAGNNNVALYNYRKQRHETNVYVYEWIKTL